MDPISRLRTKALQTDLNLKTVSFDGVSEVAKLHVHADKRAGKLMALLL